MLPGREPADRPERLKPLQEGLRSRGVRRVELAGVLVTDYILPEHSAAHGAVSMTMSLR